MRLPTFSAELVLAGAPQIVDLRSPREYARDHLPGAQSVPLFDDEQRAIVGTLYKQESPEAAYAQGLAMLEAGMGERLEAILQRPVPSAEWQNRFRDLAEELRAGMNQPRTLVHEAESLDALGPEPLILHCWRGGMRSQSVALLLRALGERRVGLLDGGYKAYRRHVLERIGSWRAADFSLLVLRGATGVGKTRLLREVEAALPGSTLDLEGLAGHRSSVLGAIGLQPVSQPRFESRLVARVAQLRRDGPILVEGESRKVGDVVIPEPIYRALETAPQVKLVASLADRVQLLGEDYLGAPGNPDQPARLAACARALDGLRSLLGNATIDALQEGLQAGRWRQVTEELLHRHYDPLYARGEGGRPDLAEVDAADPAAVARLLELRAASGPAGAAPR